MKNYAGERISKVTRPNGERSKIIVSKPAVSESLRVEAGEELGFSFRRHGK